MFRYSTALEKHKLFVSGLPFSCTKEELEEICKAHGTVKDIRLVTNRAGKPKVSVWADGSHLPESGRAFVQRLLGSRVGSDLSTRKQTRS